MRPASHLAPVLAGSLLLSAPAAHAQTSAAKPAGSAVAAPTGIVIGTIYDSLSARPLRGADVRLDGTEFTATTDAAGAFRMANVPAGEYVIAFDHAEFDSLGVGLPYGKIRVAAGDSVAVSLATPSVGAIARGLCQGLGTDTAGVLLGAVKRAGGAESPLAGARVTARWTEWVSQGSALGKQERALAATSDASGVYRLCGVPNDVAVQLVAEPPAGAGVAGARTGSARVDLHGRTGTLRDVAVRVFSRDSVGAAPTRADGAALLLRVVDAADRPVAGAQLRAAGRDAPLGVSDDQGQLRAAGLPAGSQQFQLVALGYQPRTISADLRPGRAVETVARVGARVATQLSEVRVVGRAASFDRSGFEERRHTGQGHYLTADEVAQRQPTMFTQLVVDQLGFSVTPKRSGSGYIVTSARAGSINSACPVQFFVDGVPVQSDSSASIDDVVNPTQIRGVEFYPGVGTVPARFTLAGRNACGTIAIWTGPATPARTSSQ